MNYQASIFNDVIGPVMRGPSSSHTAAAWRVGKSAVQLLDEELTHARIEFDKNGQWATNYEEQGTVLGMNGGLLGIDMADNQMKVTWEIINSKKLEFSYAVTSFENDHPNSMKLSLVGRNNRKVNLLAASLGGGSFQIQKINGFKVDLKGDQYAYFFWSKNDIFQDLKDLKIEKASISISKKGNEFLQTITSSHPLSAGLLQLINGFEEVFDFAKMTPVMPIISGNEKQMPFDTISSLITYSKNEDKSLGEIGLEYEMCRSGLGKNAIIKKMENLISIINNSIAVGLKGTHYEDRILPTQSNLVGKAEKAGKILQGSIINEIVRNVAAIMEAKSALEVIVANPTAGSCGTVGAVIKAVSDELKSSEKEILDCYFAAGLVGAYFAMGPGFSAEEHGCQVECGASAGMAAAAIVDLFGGTAEQALGAASMAIQNMIGLVCDPIADRVEAPCLGKNTSAAVNALSSATMAASGFAYLIPLDQVLETVQRVSDQMPSCNKCTGEGGLAITPAALEIKSKLSK